MRERPGLLRWGLLLVLAFCVVLMHHVPAQQHEQTHAPQPPAAVAMHAGAAEHHEQPAPAPDDHGALHLCLAIMLGFLVLLLPQLSRAIRAAAVLPRYLTAALPALLPPPLPVPRRLAALCVLRR
ncbi:hypothetical protein [Saccharopolyspora sp. NPDC002686]|uniref:hypothetical protein n=1 Tax=Saccharopolyspora sp. NPDC002686 TaxID=3154541 RepID=UPI00332F7ABA